MVRLIKNLEFMKEETETYLWKVYLQNDYRAFLHQQFDCLGVSFRPEFFYFGHLMQTKLAHVYDRLGFRSKNGEKYLDTLYRPFILQAICDLNYIPCVDAAHDEYRKSIETNYK